MLRKIDVSIIKNKVKELCLAANVVLPKDVEQSICRVCSQEKSELGKFTLKILKENIDIARDNNLPLCQDTGMVIVFLELGQEVALVGGDVNDAVNMGVKEAYSEGFFRKSIVSDPIKRENTKDNTPAILYTDIVFGNKIKITVMPKGFGSENMGRVFMLKPSDGKEGIKNAVLRAVKEAGANPCPPIILGVGIGGTMDKASVLSKKALLREVGKHNNLEHISVLEKEFLDAINDLDIGPAGFGGNVTALAVNIEIFPTHIAGLPVAISFSCHSARHAEAVL